MNKYWVEQGFFFEILVQLYSYHNNYKCDYLQLKTRFNNVVSQTLILIILSQGIHQRVNIPLTRPMVNPRLLLLIYPPINIFVCVHLLWMSFFSHFTNGWMSSVI